jgi:hypothetical protein
MFERQDSMRRALASTMMTMGTVLVLAAMCGLALMLTAWDAFGTIEIGSVSAIVLGGMAILYFAARHSRLFPPRFVPRG